MIKPPTKLPHWATIYDPVLFLGGSIEMGAATDWQDRIIAALEDENVLILNPRRDHWDSSWEHTPTLGTPFYDQVTWELDAQEHLADILVYYFDPNTKSPITLLELGMFMSAKEDIHVYCPKEFWRYGNIKIACHRSNVEVHENETSLIEAVRNSIKEREE